MTEPNSLPLSREAFDDKVFLFELPDEINEKSRDEVAEYLEKPITESYLHHIVQLPRKCFNLRPAFIAGLVDHYEILLELGGGMVLMAPPTIMVKEQIDAYVEKDIFIYCSHLHEAYDLLWKGMPEKHTKKTIRFFRRRMLSTSIMLEINDSQNHQHLVQLIDETPNGIGCLYAGDNCPTLYSKYKLESDGLYPKGRILEVRFALDMGAALPNGLRSYRIGFKFLP